MRATKTAIAEALRTDAAVSELVPPAHSLRGRTRHDSDPCQRSS